MHTSIAVIAYLFMAFGPLVVILWFFHDEHKRMMQDEDEDEQ